MPSSTEAGRPVRRVPIAIVAAFAAAAGVMMAPAPWPSGQGILQVEVSGVRRLEEPVAVGSTEAVDLAEGGVRVRIGDGIPDDRVVSVDLVLDDPAEASIDAVRVSLVLPDGTEETLPVVAADPETGSIHARRTPPNNAPILLGLLGVVVVLWITEVVALWVTSLAIPVVLVFSGAAGGTETLAPFFHPIIALFFAGFMLAEAMARVGLDRRIALSLVARLGRSPKRLFGALVLVSAGMSLWMSNTAAMALLLPIALAITEPLHAPGYRKLVVLGIAYAATIGGTGSAIGTPANALAIEFLDAYAGRQVSFVGWFAYGLPMVALSLPVIAVHLWHSAPHDIDRGRFEAARGVATEEYARLAPLTGDQLRVVAVLLLVVAGWLTQQLHGWSPGVVGLAGVVLLSLLGGTRTEDLQRISWASLLTFGGGLAIGQFMVASGTSDWMATRLALLAALPVWVGVPIVAAVTLVMTTVASNTATAAVLVPLAIPLAGLLGVDPAFLVVVVAIASSIDFALVIGTPPTMMAYSTGLVRAEEIFRIGAPLDLIVLGLLVTVVAATWQGLGLF